MTFEEKRIEKILKKIKDENLPIKFNKIVNFKNGSSLISITCEQNHTTETVSIDNFLKRGRCPECSNSIRNTHCLKSLDCYINEIKEMKSIVSMQYDFISIEHFNTKKIQN